MSEKHTILPFTQALVKQCYAVSSLFRYAIPKTGSPLHTVLLDTVTPEEGKQTKKIPLSRRETLTANYKTGRRDRIAHQRSETKGYGHLAKIIKAKNKPMYLYTVMLG